MENIEVLYKLLQLAVESYCYNPVDGAVEKCEAIASKLEAAVKVRKAELFQAIENETRPDKLVELMAEQEAFITKFWEFI